MKNVKQPASTEHKVGAGCKKIHEHDWASRPENNGYKSPG